MLLRSDRMTNNSQRNCINNNNGNNNATNTFVNNSGSNEQNQTSVPSGLNNEMVVGTSRTNNDPTNVSSEDVMRSQVQTRIVKTLLPQNSIISTTNTHHFLPQDHGVCPQCLMR